LLQLTGIEYFNCIQVQGLSFGDAKKIRKLLKR
jgi:hypothetical protein